MNTLTPWIRLGSTAVSALLLAACLGNPAPQVSVQAQGPAIPKGLTEVLAGNDGRLEIEVFTQPETEIAAFDKTATLTGLTVDPNTNRIVEPLTITVEKGRYRVFFQYYVKRSNDRILVGTSEVFDLDATATEVTEDLGALGFQPPPDDDGDQFTNLQELQARNNPRNAAPTISGTPPRDVTAGNTYTFTPQANDREADPLTFTLDGSASWLTIDPDTGTISGVPGTDDVGEYTDIRIRVQDAFNAPGVLGPFSISVSAAPAPLQVAQTIPADGDSQIDVSTPISITFTKLLNPATVRVDEFILNAGGASFSPAQVDVNQQTVDLRLSEPLPADSTVTVTVGTGLTDQENQTLTEAFSWTFTTRPPPVETGKVFQDPLAGGGVGPKMITLPGGEFLMGATDGDPYQQPDELPRHKVTFAQPFAMSQFEITIAEFDRFVQDTGYVPDGQNSGGCFVWDGSTFTKDPQRSYLNPGFVVTDLHPAVCISWNDATAYTEWLSSQTGKSYRLATEAQWEYAVRAGSQTTYFWGDDPDSACAFANAGDQTTLNKFPGGISPAFNCDDQTIFAAPVGRYNANDFGLYDLLGNAMEWVRDCRHDDYTGAPADGSAWLAANNGDCSRRMFRGASWKGGPDVVRSANRISNRPDLVVFDVGFRVVRDP